MQNNQKFILFFILVCTLLSCKNNSNPKDLALIDSLNKVLLRSNCSLDEDTRHIFIAFQNKREDHIYDTIIATWQPNALLIKKLSDSISTYIDSLKLVLQIAEMKNGSLSFNETNRSTPIKVFITNGNGNSLYKKLRQYNYAIVNIAPQLKDEFVDLSIPLDTTGTEEQNKTKFTETYFSGTSMAGALAQLTNFQNQVKITEKRGADFCLRETAGGCNLAVEKTSFLVNANTSCVKAGEKIKITAGLFEFSVEQSPIITINGKNVPLVDGIASYTITTNKPGKYTVPITAQYVDGHGVITKEPLSVQYEVEK
ncbi:MAG TPA: hypothetical protein VK718_08385 [Ferruginibacter sp.]|jgi:hypothetical protein|nr:hypothetical protein [Ferruginibacter sp.]